MSLNVNEKKESASSSQSIELETEGFGSGKDEMEAFMSRFNSKVNSEVAKQMAEERNSTYKRTTTFAFTDLCPFIRDGVGAVANDSFTKCFKSKRRIPWSNAFYLFPLYYVGVFLRYGVLFPIRCLIVLIGMIIFANMLLISNCFKGQLKKNFQDKCFVFLANVFLMSWCAVVMEHGNPAPREKGQIYVTNHSSVIDVVMMLRRQKYSLTGQKQNGLIGLFQNVILKPMGNLWFDRMESKDRKLVAEKIKEHCNDLNKPPLLVFPEGTCVNNEYVVMFKRGAFELGTCIVPAAIKYNKIFVDAFWNSREQSFGRHLFSLMTSWAVVCDIYYLEPQYRREDETSTQFAARCKELIAEAARLESVPWDGYLKYFAPKPEYKVARQKIYENTLLSRFGGLESLQKAAEIHRKTIPEAEGESSSEGAGTGSVRRRIHSASS